MGSVGMILEESEVDIHSCLSAPQKLPVDVAQSDIVSTDNEDPAVLAMSIQKKLK